MSIYLKLNIYQYILRWTEKKLRQFFSLILISLNLNLSVQGVRLYKYLRRSSDFNFVYFHNFLVTVLLYL